MGLADPNRIRQYDIGNYGCHPLGGTCISPAITVELQMILTSSSRENS